jgi:hypothetical protein
MNYLEVNNLPVIYFDKFYNNEDYQKLWHELTFLNYDNKMLGPNSNIGAYDDAGQPLKKNNGLLLDQVYSGYRKASSILDITRNIFSQEFIDTCKSTHYFFEYLASSTRDNVKVNYYEQDDEYKTHTDLGIITCVSLLYQEPKKFTGGDLIIGDKAIECKNNRLILFPSILEHRVQKINLGKSYNGRNLGRFSITHFISG